jgi:hypothetical protein
MMNGLTQADACENMGSDMQRKRYAALMLFQFRTVRNSESNRKRVCEERIILFEENDPIVAYNKALKRGREEGASYEDNGADVFFEFIGIMEFVELGESLEKDEVWWRMTEKLEPMENRNKLIPDKNDLLAFKSGNRSKRGRLLVPGR